MKITVKSSGKVYYADHWETRIVSIDEEEINGTTDWNAFRREAAKDILCAFLSDRVGGGPNYPEFMAEKALTFADALIKQLKEK